MTHLNGQRRGGLALDHLPVVTFEQVFHVGTLDEAARKAASYEGNGLSVSIHPHDWAVIARLGGAPTWALSASSGQPLRFVDWFAVTDTDEDALLAWGRDKGWVEQRTVYRVEWDDDELERTVHMEFDSFAEAVAEVADDDEDPAGQVTEVLAWRATAAFPDQRIGRDCDPADVLLAVYVRDHQPDLDGVWWDDDYDPARYSCPRGVLVHSLDRYQIERA